MPTFYVDSNAAGSGTGADWANAFTTLAAAFTAGAAGDTFYVAEDHAETQASALTLTAKGTTAAPCLIICVNSAGSVPPVSADLRTTATVSATGANDLTLSGVNTGVNYWYGINLFAGDGSTGSFRTLTTATHFMNECSFNLAGTGGNMVIGGGSPRLFLSNHDFGFSATSQNLFLSGGTLQCNGGTLVGAAVPTTLFNASSPSDWRFNGFDFSPKTSGTLLAASGQPNYLQLNSCKFGGSYTIAAPTTYDAYFDINNCDSGDTNYRAERYGYSGSQTIETTIVQTGGASDGTTPISWKIVSTANATLIKPFVCKPIMAQFNTATGSALTATVQFLHDSVTDLQDDEIWMEIEYLGTSGFPLSLFASDGLVDILATPQDQASSAAVWTTTGITNPNTQQLSVAFTPQEAGIIVVKVYVAKASYTVYVDPKVVIA